MLRRHRVPTEERELLPLHHRPASPSTLGFASPLLQTARSPDPQQPSSTPAIKRKETPHDAALAQLSTRLAAAPPPLPPPPRKSPATPANAEPSSSQPSTATSTSTTTRKKRRHYSLVPPATERIYDPCTGALRGTLSPDSPDTPPLSSASSTASSGSEKEQVPVAVTAAQERDYAAERLLAMNRIRDLQSEVVRSHHAMDSMTSVGEATNADATLSTKGNPKTKAERSSLSDMFEARKNHIDDIVKRLEELSRAVQDFHQIPTPDYDFSRLATPTQDPQPPSRYPSSSSRSSRLSSLNRARSLSPSQHPGHPSMVRQSTLPTVLDGRVHESPASTQASFRLYQHHP